MIVLNILKAYLLGFRKPDTLWHFIGEEGDNNPKEDNTYEWSNHDFSTPRGRGKVLPFWVGCGYGGNLRKQKSRVRMMYSRDVKERFTRTYSLILFII